jgi:hypothetical protein
MTADTPGTIGSARVHTRKSTNSANDRIAEIKSMLDLGLITEDQFKEKKQAILHDEPPSIYGMPASLETKESNKEEKASPDAVTIKDPGHLNTFVKVPKIELNGRTYFKQPAPCSKEDFFAWLGLVVLSFVLMGIGIWVSAVSVELEIGVAATVPFQIISNIIWIYVLMFLICRPKPIQFLNTAEKKYEIAPESCAENCLGVTCCRSKMKVMLERNMLGYFQKALCCDNGFLFEMGCYGVPGCCSSCTWCGMCGRLLIIVAIVDVIAADLACLFGAFPLGCCCVCLQCFGTIYGYKQNKDGRKIITAKMFINADLEKGGENMQSTYTIRENRKCCCIECIDWCIMMWIKVVVVVVVTVVVTLFVVGIVALLEGLGVLLLILIVLAALIFACYKWCLKPRGRYMHLTQSLYGPESGNGADVAAEVSWVTCGAKVLGYSATPENKELLSGPAGVAHKGVLGALPIMYDEGVDWPADDERLHVQSKRWWFRSINGLKVKCDMESPDVEDW